MLRKLLKHEFRATARVMIPLYLITVLLAVLTRATALWAEMVTFDGMLGRNFLALLSGIIIFGFVLALIATFVVAVILAILRFRSNLMADEGYVMFTLPVSTHTFWCSVWSPAWSFTRLWPSAIALPNIKCCCLWPSFSPSRW